MTSISDQPSPASRSHNLFSSKNRRPAGTGEAQEVGPKVRGWSSPPGPRRRLLRNSPNPRTVHPGSTVPKVVPWRFRLGTVQ